MVITVYYNLIHTHELYYLVCVYQEVMIAMDDTSSYSWNKGSS